MMSSPDTPLRRKEAAAALTAAGYKTAEATLAKMASTGGGPPYEKYGKFPLYRLPELIAWARGRCIPHGKPSPEAQ